jgi:hypothetical protein
MDMDSNYFAFYEDSIEEIIKPEMREEYEKDKYIFYTQLFKWMELDLIMLSMIKECLVYSK